MTTSKPKRPTGGNLKPKRPTGSNLKPRRPPGGEGNGLPADRAKAAKGTRE